MGGDPSQPSSDTPARGSGAPASPGLLAVRYLDLVVLAVALPVIILTGLPVLAWVVTAAVWVAQRAIEVLLKRRADASQDPRVVVGLTMGGAIGRGWLVAITILAVGISDNEIGLVAVLLVLILFTVAFTTRLITRPFERARAGDGGAS